MELNKVTQFDNTFMSPNSNLPICGHNLRDAYVNKLIQCKVNIDQVVPGTPVKLTINTSPSNAGIGLNPNVMLIDKEATTQEEISGFVVASPTDVVLPGDRVGVARKGQIVYVMPLGCGADVYLPANVDIAGSANIDGAFTWDFTNHELKKADTTATGNLHLTLKSNVVDGIKYTVGTSGEATTAKTKCVRVTL